MYRGLLFFGLALFMLIQVGVVLWALRLWLLVKTPRAERLWRRMAIDAIRRDHVLPGCVGEGPPAWPGGNFVVRHRVFYCIREGDTVSVEVVSDYRRGGLPERERRFEVTIDAPSKRVLDVVLVLDRDAAVPIAHMPD